MRRFLICIFALHLILSACLVCTAAVSQTDYSCIAFIETDSGAEGSSFNYFFAAPLVQYYDNDGVCKGSMLETFVFTPKENVKALNEAEDFIAKIMSENENLDALESAAAVLKEDGYKNEDYTLKIYVAVPSDSGIFSSEEEKTTFCDYYVKTLKAAFDKNEYKNLTLTGLYFSNSCDTQVITECKKVADESNLECLSYESLDFITLAGVPDGNNKKPLNDLKKQYTDYISSEHKSLLGIEFDAFNTLHDCAIGVAEDNDNQVARDAYLYVRDIVKTSVNTDSEKASTTTNTALYAFYAFLASAATACGIYVIVFCLRKAACK